MSFSSPEFWIALLQIIGVNIVLSGDNAVVIALAARSLPPAQQKKAVAWGSGAAVVMRIVLTIVAVELLRLPYLKLVGAALLLWIALQLLLPESEGGEGPAEAGGNLMAAIKTILIADLVMSLDNVIGVAAAAKGSTLLLVLGLAISIPLVIFASTLLLTLMGRFPVIVTLGAALLGWVAGEMAVSDPAVRVWVDANAAYLHYLAPALGAIGVVLIGRLLSRRAEARQAAAMHAGVPAHVAQGFRRVLLAVDGSEGADHALRHLLTMREALRDPAIVELHLVNVQRSLPGDVSNFIEEEKREAYHRECSDVALAPARAVLDGAGLSYQMHQHVGDPGTTIAALADTLGADLIVMGAQGMGTHTGALLGSVAQRTVENAAVPVLLAK